MDPVGPLRASPPSLLIPTQRWTPQELPWSPVAPQVRVISFADSLIGPLRLTLMQVNATAACLRRPSSKSLVHVYLIGMLVSRPSC
ncbi:unnamed protein product [Dibothriocephalus latus]|uniref:Uncharacterized protein n=1 Tax=Dibothriocephalus latus TaxID=60516 RepID=A0A3P7QWW4_DIBLA|nr:unnamed protein product [Dibothriocephalus latus]